MPRRAIEGLVDLMCGDAARIYLCNDMVHMMFGTQETLEVTPIILHGNSVIRMIVKAAACAIVAQYPNVLDFGNLEIDFVFKHKDEYIDGTCLYTRLRRDVFSMQIMLMEGAS